MSEPAFVLHQRPFKNTSQIVELFTQTHGRVAAVARGLNQPKSSLAGTLRPFATLAIDFIGKSDLKTLTYAESLNQAYHLKSTGLYAGFYANELLLCLLHKEDPHPATFAAYQTLLQQLNQKEFSAFALRQFEYHLLSEIGFGFDLNHDKQGDKIQPDKYYIFHHGLQLTDKINAVTGRCLQSLSNPEPPASLKNCTALNKFMRRRIDEALDGRRLKSRDLLKDYLRVQQ